jgi:hypothetical protein
MKYYYGLLVTVGLFLLPLPTQAQLSNQVDSDIGVQNTATNDNLNISNNENKIGISNFMIDGDRIFNDNDMINDGRQINDADFIYDGRLIEDNRTFFIDRDSGGSGDSPPPSLRTNAPPIYAPPASQYGLGGGISCPGATLHNATYTRGAEGYAQEFGSLVSVSVPLDAGLRARCEAAHQSRLATEQVQRQLTTQQANYYREQANKLRSENVLLEMRIQELERKFRGSEDSS